MKNDIAVKTELGREVYRVSLNKFLDTLNSYKSSKLVDFAKVISLVNMNMRYEKIAFDLDLQSHPYLLTNEIIAASKEMFLSLASLDFIEGSNKKNEEKTTDLVEKHKELWQEIWDRYDPEEFEEYIDLYRNRIQVNSIHDIIKGKDCVDFGCGNGVFCFALLDEGANSATGIDFGTNSIRFAQKVAQEKNLVSKVSFIEEDVIKTSLEDNSFDFAIANGVFHHLHMEDMDKALCEVNRVLKKDGWFWYYTDGSNMIGMDLWDMSVDALKGVNVIFIENVLECMNVSQPKIAHVMDGLTATYIHDDWENVTQQLRRCGFDNFKRIIGGAPWDMDHDVIERDPYGIEKFGSGDLRILCQKV